MRSGCQRVDIRRCLEAVAYSLLIVVVTSALLALVPPTGGLPAIWILDEQTYVVEFSSFREEYELVCDHAIVEAWWRTGAISPPGPMRSHDSVAVPIGGMWMARRVVGWPFRAWRADVVIVDGSGGSFSTVALGGVLLGNIAEMKWARGSTTATVGPAWHVLPLLPVWKGLIANWVLVCAAGGLPHVRVACTLALQRHDAAPHDALASRRCIPAPVFSRDPASDPNQDARSGPHPLNVESRSSYRLTAPRPPNRTSLSPNTTMSASTCIPHPAAVYHRCRAAGPCRCARGTARPARPAAGVPRVEGVWTGSRPQQSLRVPDTPRSPHRLLRPTPLRRGRPALLSIRPHPRLHAPPYPHHARASSKSRAATPALRERAEHLHSSDATPQFLTTTARANASPNPPKAHPSRNSQPKSPTQSPILPSPRPHPHRTNHPPPQRCSAHLSS